MDQFNSDFEKANKLNSDLASFIQERASLMKSGNPTGRVDYRIKGAIDSLK